MSYPTAQRLQYGVTPAQESAWLRPHVPSLMAGQSDFSVGHPGVTRRLVRQVWPPRHRLTVSATRIECLPRAAPKRRHVLFFRVWSSMRSRAHRGGLQPSVIAMTKSATSHLLPVFARADLGFERGEGAWLIATDGERYLDFTSGVAVNALGHAHPHLVAALQEKGTKLWHMSNLFKSPDGERLAARLCEASFADFVFFANSGAEAMEWATKISAN